MGGTDRGDTDLITNLLALDPTVHNGGTDSVHGRREWSTERGYLVPKHDDDPGSVPVLIEGRRWVVLTKSGGYFAL